MDLSLGLASLFSSRWSNPVSAIGERKEAQMAEMRVRDLQDILAK